MIGSRAGRAVVAVIAVMAWAAIAGAVLAAQTANGQSVSTDHGVAKTITLTGTSDAGDATFAITGGPTHGGLDASGSGNPMSCDSSSPANCSADVLYTPDSSYEGPDSFTFDVSDTDGTSSDGTVSITVGSAPVANDDPPAGCTTDVSNGSYVTLEDTELSVPVGTCDLLANDTDADTGDTLTASLVSDGTIGTASVAADGSFTYTPNADANGDDNFSYQVSDGALTSDATVHIHVTAVNDAPTFTPGTDPTVLEDSGAYSASWATSISAGPPDEQATQTVSFPITGDDNAGLFSVAPAIAADGTLTFTPAANANGDATMTVTEMDDGGTANGGVDSAAPVSLTIHVTAVNDPPTFVAGAEPTVNQDPTGQNVAFDEAGWATSISAGPTADETSTQSVSFSFTSDDNPSLFAVAPSLSPTGELTFTAAAFHTGLAHLQLVAMDDGGTANGGVDTSAPVAVTIRVNALPNAVDDNVTVPEDSSGSVLNVLANDTSLPDPPETLTIQAVSHDATHGPLHGTASVTGGGTTVTYKPVAGYYGFDFFTYRIADPLGATDTATVYVTIAKDTTAPAVSAPVQHIRQAVAMGTSTFLGQVTWSGSDSGVGLSRFDVQQSTNGGAYATLALAAPTSTAVNVTYSIGSSYRFRVRGVDRNGNVGGWIYGPTFTAARYQETATAQLSYSTSWFLTYNVNDSGSYARYSTIAGKWVVFHQSIRDVAFVAPVGPTRGSVAIYIDGVKKATISLHFTTSLYRRVLWQWHFSDLVAHQIKLVVVGNGRVDLDAFVALR